MKNNTNTYLPIDNILYFRNIMYYAIINEKILKFPHSSIHVYKLLGQVHLQWHVDIRKETITLLSAHGSNSQCSVT